MQSPLTVSELLLLNEELRLALQSGVALDLGLRESAHHLSGRLSRLAEQLSHRVQSGELLPTALEHLDPPVPVVYRILVAAGLRGNRLEAVLTRLDEFGRVLIELRESLRRAFVYPISVIIVAYLVTVLTVRLGAPALRTFLVDIQAAPTWAIRTIQWLYEWLLVWATGFPVAVIMLLGSGVILDWIRSGQFGSLGLLRFVPGLRSLRRDSELSQMAHLLSIQVEHGIPFAEALKRCAEVTTSPSLQRDCLLAAERNAVGGILPPLPSLPSFLRWILSVPSSQAQLTANLQQAADLYRDRALLQADRISRTVPAVLTIGLGTLIVGTYCFVVMDCLRVIWEKLN